MSQIITIVPGYDPDLDNAQVVVAELAAAGLIFAFSDGEMMRPADAVGGVEVQCEPADYEEACEIIAAAGFQVVGHGDA